MQKLRCFIDTHDREHQTFPAGISPAEMADFYASYEAACLEEGVVSLKIHVGFEVGRAFCINMAPNEAAVRRVHEKVGLPYDTITEVTAISPQDLLKASGVEAVASL